MELDFPYDQLYKNINAIQPLHEATWEAFAASWQPVKYKRKAVITVAGEIEKYLYFVVSGIQRGYYTHKEKEATVFFSYPHSFSGIADSFLLQSPSRQFLETITASELLRMPYQSFQSLVDEYPDMQKFAYKSTVLAWSGTLERELELMVFTAEEKFTTLLKRSPHILNLVPHKYLASYLGIDPTTFSKLLATVRL